MILKFVVVARNKPDVLARVVLLFHRAAVDIEAIRMPARGRGSELKITITLARKNPNAHRRAAILEKLVDVLSIEMISRKQSSDGGLFLLLVTAVMGETIG
jgi:acetolactate synthase small subunit